MEEKQEIRLFKKILKQLIKDLETIQNVDVNKFKDAVIDAFDGYHYEGEEEIKGFDTWTDVNSDGDYSLSIGIDHEDAYELTIFISTLNGKVSVKNVL